MMRRSERALIFDLDGTLVDSLADLRVSVNLVLAEAGRPERSLEEVRGMVGDGLPRLLARAFGGDLEEAAAASALEAFHRHYQPRVLEHSRPYPGIERVLDAAREHPLAVVSNKPETFVRPIVEGLGWGPLFGAVVGGETYPARKPDPQPLLGALSDLGCRPERALMIGDGLPDLRGGRAAGMRTCAVGWGFRSREDLLAEGPDHFCAEPEELERLLRDGDW